MKKIVILMFVSIIILAGAGCNKEIKQGTDTGVTEENIELSQDKLFEMKQSCLLYKDKADKLQDADLIGRLNGKKVTAKDYLVDYAHVAYSPILNTCVAYYDFWIFNFLYYGCNLSSLRVYSIYDLLSDKSVYSSYHVKFDGQKTGNCLISDNFTDDPYLDYLDLLKKYKID